MTPTPEDFALARRIFSATMLEGLAGVVAEGGLDRWWTINAEDAVKEIIDLTGPALDAALFAVFSQVDEVEA